MSIYGTWLAIEHPDQWVASLGAKGIRAGVIGDDSESRDLGSPWVYQGSHVLPAESDRRGGSVHVCAIPDFITRDGRDDGGEGPKDWLRLSVDSEDSDTQHEGKPYVLRHRCWQQLQEVSRWPADLRDEGVSESAQSVCPSGNPTWIEWLMGSPNGSATESSNGKD